MTSIRGLLATAGAAGCLLLLWSLTRVDGVPSLVVVSLFALAAVSAWKPDAGVFTAAVFLPLAAFLGRRWNYQVSWAEAVVVALAAGLCVRAIAGRRADGGPTRLPAAVMALVVGASLAEQLWALQLRVGTDALLAQLGSLLDSTYFLNRGFTAVDFAMRLLEGLLLFQAAASLSRNDPTLLRRLTQAICLGAALAAAATVAGLWASARTSATPVATFARFVATVRWNEHYGDLNAAGSYYVMTLFAALGLARGARAWIVPSVLIALGLWIAGSRTAMLAGGVAALVLAIPALRRPSRRSAFALAALVLFVLTAAVVGALRAPARGNQKDPLTAARVRVELAETSLRMTGSHPLTGVGIGQYRMHSGAFSSPELLVLFPPARDENAHNNFLQVLAELGIAGLAAFLWVLWTAARSTAASLKSERTGPVHWGVAAGLLAFVLTWLGGHPLLIDEPAMTFWLLLGAGAGAGAAASAIRPGRRAVTLLAAAALALSVPPRAHQQIAAADLEHVGIGVSAWHRYEDGVRYRLAGATSTVFVPADARTVSVPLRSAVDATELQVNLTLDGRAADVVRVPSDRWYDLRLQMPQSGGARFRRLQFDVAGAPSGEAALLMIGKVEPR